MPAQTVGVGNSEITGGHGISLRTGTTLAQVSAAGPEAVVVIFSYTGIYFDYGLPRTRPGKGPKVWLVTGSPDIRERFAQEGLPADRLLTFRSKQDFASHPYQLQIAASLIAQRYGAMKSHLPDQFGPM